MNTTPKPFYLTSYFYLLVITILAPFVLPPLATLVLKYSAFTPDQQARYMEAVFSLVESSFKYIGATFVLIRGSVSVVKVIHQLFPQLGNPPIESTSPSLLPLIPLLQSTPTKEPNEETT